jgi:CubicO group peptidase (beta-lactamase class C family)
MGSIKMNVSSHPLTRYRVDLLVVVSSVLLLAQPQPLYPRQSGNHPDIASVLKKYQMLIPGKIQKEKVPGFAIGVVDKDGILWSDGYGFTDLSKTKRVDSQTIFSIQSISKTFTATAVLHAVQEGILDHNEPVTTYLPDFTVNSRFEENPCSRITLKLLLSHRAGFTHEAPIGNNYDASFSSFEEHVLSIQDTWLKFPVGERFSYSNLGIDLAGYILQVVSGMPFHEYVRQNIFKPMDMANSSFDTEWIKRNNNRASGHSEIIPNCRLRSPSSRPGVCTPVSKIWQHIFVFTSTGG